MSALSLPYTFEKRTVAVLFCEIAALDWSTVGLSEVLSPELRESLDLRFKQLLRQHDGTFVSAIANTFIALFEAVEPAVRFPLDLQEAFARDPPIALRKPSEISAAVRNSRGLDARFSVHYEQLYVEAARPVGESLTDRLGHALRATVFRRTEVQTARVGGKGLNVAARLLRRVPPSGIGLSDEAHATIGPDLAKSFRRIMAAPTSGAFDKALTASAQLPVWLYSTIREANGDTNARDMMSSESLSSVIGTSLQTEIGAGRPEPSLPPSDRTLGVAAGQTQTFPQESRPISLFHTEKDNRVMIERLLEPIPGETPSGPNLQYDEVFEQIKEARIEDDDSLPAGVWSTTPRKASRLLAGKLAYDALAERTKDLRLVGWYLESLVHTAGFAVLPDGLELIRRLQEDFWATVHPASEADGNVELRSAAIEGALNLLATAIALVPLTRDGVNWLNFHDAGLAGLEAEEDLRKSIKGTPNAFYVETEVFLNESLERLFVLNKFHRIKFGEDYPRVARLKSALENIRDAVHGILATKRSTEAHALEQPKTSSLQCPTSGVGTADAGELTKLFQAFDSAPAWKAAPPFALAPAAPPQLDRTMPDVGLDQVLEELNAPKPPVSSKETSAWAAAGVDTRVIAHELLASATAGNFTATFQGLSTVPPAPVAVFAPFAPATPIDCASEAIVVIDIVQATATSDLFGWYSVGRHSVRHLRQIVREIGELYGLACMKSTGDGLLLTYRDDKAADLAAVNAVQASLDLLKRLSDRNETAPEERQIAIRLALHFGEVDVLPDDREGPNVSFTFRVEAINHASLDKALNPIDPTLMPLRDYILCSERIHDIVERRKPEWQKTSCGLFKLKGFTSWHELFLVSEQPRFDA